MRHIQTLCPLCAYHIGDVFAHSYFSGIDSALYSEDLSILSRMVGTLLSVVKSTMEIATHCNQPRMMRWKSLFIVTSKLQPQCRWCDMSQKGYIFYILAVVVLVPWCPFVCSMFFMPGSKWFLCCERAFCCSMVVMWPALMSWSCLQGKMK